MTDRRGCVAELDGRVAIVTGSGGEMGAGIALALARAGARIVLNDRLRDSLDAQEAMLRQEGADVISVLASVTRRHGAEQLVDAARARWGRVDVLVNNVGGIRGPMDNPVWEMSEEDWDSTLAVNLKGTFHCTQLVLPEMIERRSGKIVNIASIAWAGHPFNAAYATSKAGVVAFTRSVATAVAPFGINVNAVAPGVTRTSAVERMHGHGVEPDWTDRNPMGRPNDVTDIADAVLYLVSDRSRNVSGQVLHVAGGLNASL